ncbi:MAG TPA: hypothetical protein VFI84_00560 [Candidatus Saccharimonadales bacterium]|nr:hypothetical protein [Candidatus Saccharimonadales bacterium]
MGVEAPKIQIPEQRPKADAELADAFTSAQHAVYKLTAGPHFRDLCHKRGVDPDNDMGEMPYWDTVEEFSSAFVEKNRSLSGNSLRLSTFELLAATPAYIFHETALTNGSLKTANAVRQSKEMASYYNSLLRVFATEFPDSSVATSEGALLGMTNMALESKEARQHAAWLIHSSIRGAQHELAFGQILAHTGRDFSPTSLDEDLNGADYTVDGSRTGILQIDVKASLDKIEQKGETKLPYTVSSDGKITMYSMVKDSEFHDKFFIPEAVAAQKAPAVDRLLTEAEHAHAIGKLIYSS